MKFWIICSGETEKEAPGKCSGAEFDAWRAERLGAGVVKGEAHAVKANGRAVYCSPRPAAGETAAMLVDAEAIPERMLDEIGRRAGSAEKKLPAWLWASPDTAAKDEARCRADELIDRLERQGKDCILVSHPRMIELLMDRLRVRGYVAQRTGFGRVRPWEQMLLSRRDEHCGFCNHNCLLTNPGCDIGRDKARRQGVKIRK